MESVDSKKILNYLSKFYNLVDVDSDCYRFESKEPKGKRILHFNEEGFFITIKEDGNTRTAFNGRLLLDSKIEPITQLILLERQTTY